LYIPCRERARASRRNASADVPDEPEDWLPDPLLEDPEAPSDELPPEEGPGEPPGEPPPSEGPVLGPVSGGGDGSSKSVRPQLHS